MDYNFFTPPTWKQKQLLKVFSPINKLFKIMDFKLEITHGVNYQHDMITTEQRMNLFHLLNEVIVHNAEGEIVEMGCYIGKSALQIQTIISSLNTNKQFYVYDKFNSESNTTENIRETFTNNFREAKIELPYIIEGNFYDTVPNRLPDRLSFIHIDCGWGGSSNEEHQQLVIYLLKHIYQRMSSGSICLIMDYHDEERTFRGHNSNPGVKIACDSFFKDLPEKVHVLYGNQFSHGYFRKK